jgi:hypothetical protein
VAFSHCGERSGPVAHTAEPTATQCNILFAAGFQRRGVVSTWLNAQAATTRRAQRCEQESITVSMQIPVSAVRRTARRIAARLRAAFRRPANSRNLR